MLNGGSDFWILENFFGQKHRERQRPDALNHCCGIASPHGFNGAGHQGCNAVRGNRTAQILQEESPDYGNY
jgi:hypothetical protein